MSYASDLLPGRAVSTPSRCQGLLCTAAALVWTHLAFIWTCRALFTMLGGHVSAQSTHPRGIFLRQELYTPRRAHRPPMCVVCIPDTAYYRYYCYYYSFRSCLVNDRWTDSLSDIFFTLTQILHRKHKVNHLNTHSQMPLLLTTYYIC